MKINTDDFIVVCFRPSTVFGVSPRMRCDIVYNNLVACAYTTGKIEILSDGSPWRPVVHVKDVCRAFISGLEAPEVLVGGKAFNVGIPNGNFTVKNLAEAAQRSVPGSELRFLNEHTDPRTYRVSFKRIFEELGEWFNPDWDLDVILNLLNLFAEHLSWNPLSIPSIEKKISGEKFSISIDDVKKVGLNKFIKDKKIFSYSITSPQIIKYTVFDKIK